MHYRNFYQCLKIIGKVLNKLSFTGIRGLRKKLLALHLKVAGQGIWIEKINKGRNFFQLKLKAVVMIMCRVHGIITGNCQSARMYCCTLLEPCQQPWSLANT